MWNKHSLFLLIRLKIKGTKPRLRFWLPLALYVPHQLLLACDGVLGLVPGQPGQYARNAVGAVHAVLIALMHSAPQELVDVEVQDKKQYVKVVMKTAGWKGREE